MTEKKKKTGSQSHSDFLINKFLGIGNKKTYVKSLILGDCPKCKIRTELSQLPEKTPGVFFQCATCGGLLEQKQNGKITYDIIGEAHISIHKNAPPEFVRFDDPDEI